MKKKKNTFAKFMAIVALLAIVISIVGTGILVIFEMRSQDVSEISAQEIQELINAQEGNIEISS